MTSPRATTPLAARAACAALVALYPPWVRRRYGADMRQFFADACEDARSGRPGRVARAFYARAFGSLAANALVAWFDTPAFVADRSWRRLDASWSDGSPRAGAGASWSDWVGVVRQALRGLRRAPAFSLVTITTLAIGIGATTTVFSAVNGVILAALPYPDVDRLVTLHEQGPPPLRQSSWVAEETFRDWQQRTRRFQALAAWRLAIVTLTGHGDAIQLQGYAVTTGYFDVMKIPMTLGRGFASEEDHPGGPKAVVLSHGLWRRRFGANPRVLGTTIMIDKVPHTVVGVAGPRLEYPDRAEYWLPLALDYSRLRGTRYLAVVARLAARTSPEEARADLVRVARDIAREAPESNAEWSADLRPLRDEIAGDLRPFVVGGFAAVLVLLLAAVANVTSLFVARLTNRQEELAVRRALGAGPARLLHLFLTEAMLTTIVGGLAGIAAAAWGTRVLALALESRLPNPDTMRLDYQVLGFAGLVTLFVGLVLGLLPAILAPRLAIADSLRAGMRTLTGRTRVHRVRTTLVTLQVTLAVVLLVGAVLLGRSLRHLQRVDSGFDARNVLTFDLQLPDGTYDDARRAATFAQVRASLGAVPGVVSVGTVFPMPMVMGSVAFPVATPAMNGLPPVARPMAHSRLVSPGYHEAMRIPLLQGRTFTDDDREGRLPVVMINQALARRAFGAHDPIGQRLTFQEPSAPDAEWLTVVGVVGDVAFRRLWNEREPEVYRPVMQAPFSTARVVVRTRQDPDRLLLPIAAALHDVDPDVPLADVRTLEAIVAEGLAVKRLITALLTLFAGAAAVLALVGVMGVLSVAVTARLREMGVRLALGAAPRQIVGLVVAGGMRAVAIGTTVGLGAAVAGTRLVAAHVHGVSPLDPWSFAIAGLGFLTASTLVCLWPAVRAARENPVNIVRSE